MFGSGDAFAYAECGGCGSVRLLDVPDDLAPFYPTDYYSIDADPETILGRFPVRQFVRHVGRSALSGRRLSARAATGMLKKREFQTLMTILSSVRLAGLPRGRSSSVLDVGCGSGVLLYALSLTGLDRVVGIDPFAPGDRTFDTGAQIRKQDLSDARGPFDLVMLHHSLEHVPDPAETLSQARDVLTDDGRILVRMPTVSSHAFRTYRESWVQLDAPRHLSVLSREGMAELCRSQGLEIEHLRDDSTSFQYWGSEQVRRGISLEDPRSYFVDPSASVFGKDEVARWQRDATEANRSGDGDQAVWVLKPAH